MNLYHLFDIYSRSGEVTSSGVYMLRSALKRLYEAYDVKEGEEIEESSFSCLLNKLEDYLHTQNKTLKVIRENKYWIRRLIKFGVKRGYFRLKKDQIAVTPEFSKSSMGSVSFASSKEVSGMIHSGVNKEDILPTKSAAGNTKARQIFHDPDKIEVFKTPWGIKLILIFLGLVIIGMIFIADLIHRQIENHVFEQFQQHQLVIAHGAANGLQEFIMEIENEISFLNQLPAVQLKDSRCLEELNKIYQINKKYIRSIRQVDVSGNIVFGVTDGEGEVSKKLPDDIESYFLFYQEQADQIHSAVIYTQSTEKNPALLLFFPMNLRTNPLVDGRQEQVNTFDNDGFIIVEVDLLKTAETFIRHIDSGDQGYGLLINRDGLILYHPNVRKIGEEFYLHPEEASDLRLYQGRQTFLQKIRQNQEGWSKDLKIFENGHWHVFAYSPFRIHDEQWAVMVAAPYKEIHPIKRLHYNIAFLMIGLICLLSLGSFIIFTVNKKRVKIEEEIKYLEKKLEMEDQICESEERLRAILDSIASDRISIMDKKLNVIWANRVAFQNYGDIIGKKCYQVYKGLDGPCRPCPVQETFLNGKICSSEELALIDKDGKSILYLTNSSPIRDRHGNIISVVETSKDITERMRLLEEIKSKRDLLDTILNNMSDGVRVIDAKYNILFMNQNLIALFGNQINQKCYRIFMGRETPCSPCVLDKIFQENQNSFSIIKENAKNQLVEISASALGITEGGHSIIEVVRDITERRRLETQLIESEQRRIKELKERYRFGNIIGKSSKMQEIYELIQVVSQNSTTVLLLGESGTGKELIARAIHYNSPQHEKAFVEVCCSVLSENLLESELFGHVKGAFTGAIRDKVGRFEMADGGSVFLDEVGDISLSVQVKLLRVIQEREFIPVGGEKVKKVNVRIIAATNSDLKKAVEYKEFREDLYYRLNVVPIHIPPLRERMEDLPLLVNHFIEKFREKTNKQIQSIDSSAINILLSYSWPGNIRELENAIEHAFVRCDTTVIEPKDLPLEIRQSKSHEVKKSFDQKDVNIADLKKDVLLKVLKETNWDPAVSAQKLKISRATFYRWLKRYNIKRNSVS